MMEFKIQVSIDGGKIWVDSNSQPENNIDFDYVKSIVNKRRKMNPCRYKYRIVGREIIPWCEIKENN